MSGRSSLRGQVVIVTGATAGVGRATAAAFAAAGARVGLLGRSRDALEATRRELHAGGGDTVAVACDVADATAVQRAADLVEATFGPVDVWVNNAMVSVFAEFPAVTPDEFRRVTDVTYLGYVWGTRTALRTMVPRDRGVIVQVGSALAHRSIPLQSAYCGAKHAVKGFTQSVRTELLHRNSHVQITMVQLPAVNTPQFDWVRSRLARRSRPVPPIYQPEVPARAIVWAATHPKRELWVGPSTVAALLVNKVAANLLDHYVARTGYDAQQTEELEDPDRSSNLWEPVPRHRTHGRFDADAAARSWQVEVATKLWSGVQRLERRR